jgi:hypothetical protein
VDELLSGGGLGAGERGPVERGDPAGLTCRSCVGAVLVADYFGGQALGGRLRLPVLLGFEGGISGVVVLAGSIAGGHGTPLGLKDRDGSRFLREDCCSVALGCHGYAPVLVLMMSAMVMAPLSSDDSALTWMDLELGMSSQSLDPPWRPSVMGMAQSEQT